MSRKNVLDRYRTELRDRFLPDRIPAVTTVMVLVTVFLWTTMLSGWLPTPSMPGPMTAPGVPEAMGTSNGLAGVLAYLLLWGVMMSAMMYPAMVPLARQYADELDDEESDTEVAFLVALFGTYSLTWLATGVVPLAVDVVAGIGDLAATAGPYLVGGLGLFVAAYQQSAFKLDALRQCCRSVDLDDVSLGIATSHGFEHAVNCIVSTWPYFALMVVAGSMNPTVMLALTFVIAAERLPTCRAAFTRAIGITAGIAGLLVLLVPSVLP